MNILGSLSNLMTSPGFDSVRFVDEPPPSFKSVDESKERGGGSRRES